jgi:hypothetical protein
VKVLISLKEKTINKECGETFKFNISIKSRREMNKTKKNREETSDSGMKSH